MVKYLLDTNIIIDLLRGTSPETTQLIVSLGISNCAISDITLYELYVGVELFGGPDGEAAIERIVGGLTVLPSKDGFREAARQYVRLKAKGETIEDLDLFIGCTAIVNDLYMVTGNVKQLSRLENIRIL